MSSKPVRIAPAVQNKIRSSYPLIVNMIKRHGHIAPYDKVVKTFSQEAVTMALDEHIITQTSVVKRYIDNTRPPQTIKALKLSTYNNSRPPWIYE